MTRDDLVHQIRLVGQPLVLPEQPLCIGLQPLNSVAINLGSQLVAELVSATVSLRTWDQSFTTEPPKLAATINAVIINPILTVKLAGRSISA